MKVVHENKYHGSKWIIVVVKDQILLGVNCLSGVDL